jgi:hypothetical protein
MVFTSANLVLKIEVRLPCDPLFGAPSNKERPTIDHAADLVDRLHSNPNYACQHLTLASTRKKTRYDRLSNWLTTKRVTMCGYMAQPTPKESHPNFNRRGKASIEYSTESRMWCTGFSDLLEQG